MISPVERNLFLVNAAGYTISALSAASLAFFGLHTYVNIEKLTTPSLCMPDVCDQIKQAALEALPGSISATALSALALYSSITFTRQLSSHTIKHHQ
jgi:hypothetical protein